MFPQGLRLTAMVCTSNITICCAVLSGKVGIWDTATGQCKHMLEGPDGSIEWAQWHPKGDVILAGSDDFTAWLWNAQTGTCMQVTVLFHICLLMTVRMEEEPSEILRGGKPGRTQLSHKDAEA